MKRIRRIPFLFLMMLAFLTMATRCEDQKAEGKTETASTLSELVKQYSNGEVMRCSYQGQTVYRCSRNAPDGGSEVYDAAGEKIGGCYYSTGAVDPICESMTDCEVIFRAPNNIWGKPAVGSLEDF